ncbi:MAG: type II secretion system protein [Phycisphaerales bacterium]|nr:type II secretion system protein [Phycisphaerales bacterium]
MPSPRPQLRRGVTFVEVICAVALIAIIATVSLSGVSSILAAQERQIRRISAAELANRIILQFLDDRDSVPAPGTVLRADGAAFRFELRETPVRLEPARAEVAAERTQLTPTTLDRLSNVSVLVWLAEESGGSVAPVAGTPAVQLTRIVDPIALITRNPDSLRNMMQDPEKYRRMLEQFMGPGTPRGGSAGTPPPSPPGGKPASSPAKGGGK